MEKRSELIAAIVRNYLGMPPLYHEQGYGLNPACSLSIFIRYSFYSFDIVSVLIGNIPNE